MTGGLWDTNPKGLLQSRVTWGIIVTVLGIALNRFGFEISDKASFIDNAMAVVAILSEAIGPLLALWGNVKRSKPIDGIIKFD